MIHVLAPVPAIHVNSAFSVKNNENCVAFGSNAFVFFQKLTEDVYNSSEEVKIWIIASSTGSDIQNSGSIKIGRIVAEGTFRGFITTKRGIHPNPKFRPSTTLETDTHFDIFWEIEGLTRVFPEKYLTSVLSESGNTIKSTPLGPIRISGPDE